MTKDNDTPPPTKANKSDAEIRLPIDADWFHGWRKDIARTFSEFRDIFHSIDTRLHEGSMTLFKHDSQISDLTKDQAANDIETKAQRTRIEALEQSDRDRKNRELLESGGIGSQVRNTIVLTSVGAITLGFFGLLWYLISLYAKYQLTAPGVTP